MRRLDRYRAVASVIGLCAAVSACYSYTTIPVSTVPIGERVRVRVSGAQAERLEPVLGFTNREIEGELLAQADSSITLQVPLPLPPQDGGITERAHQRIVIPRADVQDVELRQLDKFRTTVLVGAGVAGVAVAIAAGTGAIQLGSGGSRGTGNESRTPPIVPVLKWRIVVP